MLLAGCPASEPPPPPTFEERLAEASDGLVLVERDDAGGVRAVAGRFAPPSSVPADPDSRARWFLGEHGAAFGIDDPESDVRTAGTVEGEAGTPEEGDTVVTYERTEDGVPVYGAEVKVEVSADGTVVVVVGHVPADVAVPTTPRISREAAIATALAAHPGATASGADLVILNEGLFLGVETASSLTWMVRVDAGILSHPTRFVDAIDGSLLGFATPRVVEARRRSTWTTRGLCDDIVGTQVYDEAGAIAGTTATADATTVHDAARIVWDYYWNAFRRDGRDGRGAEVVSVTDFAAADAAGACVPVAGAFWSGDTQKHYFGPGYLSLDVMGHEYTHGLIDVSAKLVYASESGALNESMADVFGAFIDTATQWTIGDGIPGGAIRDLANPHAFDQPWHTNEKFDFVSSASSCTVDADCGTAPATRSCTGIAAAYFTSSFHCTGGRCVPVPGEDNDYLGVHCNSGIPNHAAYLAVAGGPSPTGEVEVVGIGQAKAEQIWFRALAWYMTAAMDFMGARIALWLAAYKFAQREMHGVTYADCGSVLTAYGAVGVGSIDSDRDCVTDALDNCPEVYNPDQDRAACRGPMCSGRGGPCERSGPDYDDMCCDDLICVVRGCTHGGCGRERAACADASECCRGLQCRRIGAMDGPLQCCARDADPCEAKEDCCGLMDCVGGTCRGRATGEECLIGDCIGGSFCDAGTCT